MQRAYAIVDLKTIANNIKKIKNKLPKTTKFMAIVKADAYGHGAIEVARIAIAQGAEYLGVAWIKEAEYLRSYDIKKPILLLSEPSVDNIEKAIDLNITQTVYTDIFLEALIKQANKMQKKTKVHIKIDTGMNRIGVLGTNALSLAKKIIACPFLELEGIFTHFACADEAENPYTWVQFANFKRVIKELENNKIYIPIKHAANSAATFNFQETWLDMVRVGIKMYQSALSFKSRVTFVKDVKAGQYVSYGATYKTKQDTKLATISVGYADGFSRRLSNQGSVLINGYLMPIVGRICMDMTIVDVQNHNVKIDDEVVLIGTQGTKTITADDIAKQIDTVNYEVLCGIGKRVPRIYN